MDGHQLHTLFNVLAWAGGAIAGVFVRRTLLRGLASSAVSGRTGYLLAAGVGGGLGGTGLGTLNVLLSGMDGTGESMLGFLAGAVLGVEIYKRMAKIHASTGLGFVASLAFGISVGRIGCLLAGLDDYTYGAETSLPWGWDFGDGLRRHPVQLYESMSMAGFLAWFLLAAKRRRPLVLSNGFHLFLLVYAGQRFAWEFLKPYPAVLGPFNVFHLVCAALAAFALHEISKSRRNPPCAPSVPTSSPD